MPNEKDNPQAEQPKGLVERARTAWNNLTNRVRPAEGNQPSSPADGTVRRPSVAMGRDEQNDSHFDPKKLLSQLEQLWRSQTPGMNPNDALRQRLDVLSRSIKNKPVDELDDNTISELIQLDAELGMIDAAAEKRQLLESDPEVSKLVKSKDVKAIVAYLDSHSARLEDGRFDPKRGEVLTHLLKLAKEDGEKMQAEFSLATEIEALQSNSLEDVLSGKVDVTEMFLQRLAKHAHELGYGQYTENMTLQVRYLPNPQLSRMNFVPGSSEQNELYRQQQIEDNSWDIAQMVADRIVAELKDKIKTEEQYSQFKTDVKNGYPEAQQILKDYGVPEEIIPALMNQQVLPKLRGQVFSSSEVFFRMFSSTSEERRREDRE